MKKIILISVLLIIALLCGQTMAITQPVIFFNPDVVESNTGDDDSVVLMMDGAYRGLSGFGLIISIDNPDIADITCEDLPAWVGLKDIQKLNNSAYLVQGTDINDMQNPGSIQFPIANIRVHANAPGYATIVATPLAIDDDQKGRYLPAVATGSIVITGAGPVPVIPMST